MTVDSEEGQRQIEAMQPKRLKVGDRVRLAAGGREMIVALIEDYGNKIICEWEEPETHRDHFPASSLVRIDSEKE